MNYRDLTKISGLVALAVLAGCGHPSMSSLAGTYQSPTDQGSITFRPDGSALLNVGGQEIATTYTLASDTVELTPPAGVGGGKNVHFKIDGDGCLHGELNGTTSSERICKRP